MSFLFSPTLASALYLLLLKFINRDYLSSWNLIDGVGTDVALTAEENQSLEWLGSG